MVNLVNLMGLEFQQSLSVNSTVYFSTCEQ